MPTIAIIGWGLLIAGVLIHLTGLGVGQTTPDTWPPILIGAIGYLGVFATALTFSAYFALISRIGAVQAALVSYMIPVVTAVVGWLLLEQVVTLSTVSGFLVIAVGFGLTEHEYVSEMLEWTRDHTERRPADD
jgi:drug/metabolite transporter (DMT)-like permease